MKKLLALLLFIPSLCRGEIIPLSCNEYNSLAGDYYNHNKILFLFDDEKMKITSNDLVYELIEEDNLYYKFKRINEYENDVITLARHTHQIIRKKSRLNNELLAFGRYDCKIVERVL
tara:strand:+ start:721 stop:1071 length:351 start_codon:yes stop_codon:yes gene_type:complete